jgi:predicted glycoside hydrolase/deacetylase ChbG (UPF0249 family)
LRRLIINADDFGLTAGVNRAILEATTQGVVTSTTLMASGPTFDDAVSLSRSVPQLGIGCHVILAGAHPCPMLPGSRIPSLVQSAPSKCSHFHKSLTGFAKRALTGKLDPDQIEAEATAQFRKVQSAGIAMTHFDTHKHTHLFPQVLRPLLRAARTCGLAALRNPFPPQSTLPFSMLLSNAGLWKRHLQVKWLGRFSRSFQDEVQKAGMVSTDGTIGIVITGSLNMRLFQTVIANLPEGTWEFVCHPGYNDRDLQAAGTRLLQSRVQELEVLTSHAARESLERNDIQLINFRDLVR